MGHTQSPDTDVVIADTKFVIPKKEFTIALTSGYGRFKWLSSVNSVYLSLRDTDRITIRFGEKRGQVGRDTWRVG